MILQRISLLDNIYFVGKITLYVDIWYIPNHCYSSLLPRIFFKYSLYLLEHKNINDDGMTELRNMFICCVFSWQFPEFVLSLFFYNDSILTKMFYFLTRAEQIANFYYITQQSLTNIYLIILGYFMWRAHPWCPFRHSWFEDTQWS
jgi:hypothetical protein